MQNTYNRWNTNPLAASPPVKARPAGPQPFDPALTRCPIPCPTRRRLLANLKANVIISFNNFPAKDSVPFLNELRELGLSMGNFGPLGDNLSGIAKA